jgi:hypothetical protein
MKAATTSEAVQKLKHQPVSTSTAVTRTTLSTPRKVDSEFWHVMLWEMLSWQKRQTLQVPTTLLTKWQQDDGIHLSPALQTLNDQQHPVDWPWFVRRTSAAIVSKKWSFNFPTSKPRRQNELWVSW